MGETGVKNKITYSVSKGLFLVRTILSWEVLFVDGAGPVAPSLSSSSSSSSE